MKVNRRKELFPNVTNEQWNDWKWQVKNRIETYEELSKYFTFDAEEAEGIKKALAKFRMAITPYYLSLIDPNPPVPSATSHPPTSTTRCTRMRIRPLPD